MIEVKNISFTYPGSSAALKGASFGCARGTITGIIGPNGSGKTTLIKVMAGLLAPEQGSICINDRELSDCSVAERSKQIAYVPQSEHIPFPFTAFEVVLMGRAPHRSSFAFESAGDVDIAREAMCATETDGFAARSLHELSGGECQRVIIARALAQRPKLMLLDEPTASLDIKHQIDLYTLLARRCREDNLTVVAAMHDLNLALQMCDRVVALKEGKLAAAGVPAEVMSERILSEVFSTSLCVSPIGKGSSRCVFPASNV